MVLTTHQVVGGAIAKIFNLNPISAFFAGVVSHYLLDGLPHWDYPLGSATDNGSKSTLDGDIKIGKKFIADIFRFAPDFLLGMFIALHFFSNSDYSTLSGIKDGLFDPVLWGALGGIVPDALQFCYFKIRREPLTTLQRFHEFMHTKFEIKGKQGTYLMGIFVQVFIILLVVVLFSN